MIEIPFVLIIGAVFCASSEFLHDLPINCNSGIGQAICDQDNHTCFQDVSCSSQFKINNDHIPFSLTSRIKNIGENKIIWQRNDWNKFSPTQSHTIMASDPRFKIISRQDEKDREIVISELNFPDGATRELAGIYTCFVVDPSNVDELVVVASVKFYLDVITSESQSRFTKCHHDGPTEEPCFEPYYHPHHSISLRRDGTHWLNCAFRHHRGPVVWMYQHEKYPAGYMIVPAHDAAHLYADLYNFAVHANSDGIYTCLLLDPMSPIKPGVSFYLRGLDNDNNSSSSIIGTADQIDRGRILNLNLGEDNSQFHTYNSTDETNIRQIVKEQIREQNQSDDRIEQVDQVQELIEDANLVDDANVVVPRMLRQAAAPSTDRETKLPPGWIPPKDFINGCPRLTNVFASLLFVLIATVLWTV